MDVSERKAPGFRIQEPGGTGSARPRGWRGAALSHGSSVVLQQAAPENVSWSAMSQRARRSVFRAPRRSLKAGLQSNVFAGNVEEAMEQSASGVICGSRLLPRGSAGYALIQIRVGVYSDIPKRLPSRHVAWLTAAPPDSWILAPGCSP